MKNKLITIKEFLTYLVNKFSQDRCFESASALTYTTLLSIVPFMAVSFFIARHMPFFNDVWADVEQYIFSNFVPTTGIEIRQYLLDFVAHAGTLSLYGSIFLFISAITLLYTIEMTFDRIWRVQFHRPLITSFFLYCALLICTPPVMGLSFVLSTYLWLFLDYFQFINTSYFLKILPLILTWGAFTMLYTSIPNCKVVRKHALLGALIAALLFEGAKFFFALYVATMNSNMLIYGAFAIIPIFLFWLYISWLIVLLGAEIICSMSCYRDNSKLNNGICHPGQARSAQNRDPF